ncbi:MULTISPECIES: porin [Paracoccus]|uniref:Porin n=1 Tax=Paracoccus mutanolyticus TaxID=1499308 RepID=A0ABM6WQX9_9RHOB|nr:MULTISPECIES: porin [Paracoccus]AWX93046.1 porin [Paracoccus mutanolyticus]MBY0138301.1 porin [Paracoccus yeei]
MKKVLFATSALVLSAGFASAEVAVSGDGRMGVIYDGNDAQFSSRARVKFTLTGESDSGLSFGGAFRVDQENYTFSNSDGYNSRSAARGTAGAVWISGTYGKLSMGDVVSASEAAIGDLAEVGYTDGEFAGDPEELFFLTGDGVNIDQGPNILYEYTINNISLYASASDGVNRGWYTTVGSEPAEGIDTASTAYALAAKYEGSNFWASLSYSKHDDAREIGLAAEGSFNNFSVKGVYLDYDDNEGFEIEQGPTAAPIFVAATLEKTYGLSMAYQMDAILVEGFYRRDELESLDGTVDADFDSFGIGVEYDLGGGAVLAGGIIDTDYLDDTVVDAGIKFSF